MKKLLVCLYIIFSCTGLFSQSKHESELLNLMNQSKWFEADEYIKNNPDNINEFFKLCTESFTETYFNNPESSIKKISELLNKYGANLGANNTFKYTILLINNLVEAKKYDEAIFIVQDILNKTEGKLPTEIEDGLKSRLANYIFYRDNPCKITQTSGCEAKLDIVKNEVGLYLELESNGQKLRTWFDTGCSSATVSKDVAEQLNIKKTSENIFLTNGTRKTQKGVIDSVFIGQLIIYNFPVDIIIDEMIIDSVDYNKLPKYDIVLGVEIMKLLEKSDIDLKNKTITFSNSSRKENKTCNMLAIDNLLYVKTKINNINNISLLDSGYESGTFINPEFFKENKSEFEIVDTQKHKLHIFKADGIIEKEYYNLSDTRLSIGEKQVMLPGCKALLNEPVCYPGYPIPDGIIGYDLYSSTNRVVLDFVNMTFEIY